MCLDRLVGAEGFGGNVAGVGFDAELVELVETLEKLVFVRVVQLSKGLLVWL